MTEGHKRTAEMFMLSLVVWRESRGSPRDAQNGVAFSVLDRVAHPRWWGHTILSCIRQKYQYSSFTDPKDKQLCNWPDDGDASWWQCMDVAQSAMDGTVANPVPNADSYYDDSIPRPKWASDANFIAKLGRLSFHNTKNG
jgi:N-acetylmuramoyl-L-alanine amidase